VVHCAAVALAVLCSLAVCDQEAAGLAEAAAVAEAAPAAPQESEEPQEKQSYSKIPFFVFKDGSEFHTKARTQRECQDICGGRPDCASYSWSARKSQCLTSARALSFNGDFTFFSKRVFSAPKSGGDNVMGRYRRFDGLMYQSKDFTRYEDKSEKECKKFCDTAVDGHNRKCNGFSYSENTKVCLLSPFGLNYDEDFDYYERNPDSVVVEVKVKDPKTGKVVLIKKEEPSTLDVSLKEKEKPWNKSPEYQAQLTMQESAAKEGAKELAHKNLNKKAEKHEQKALKSEEYTLIKEEKKEAKKVAFTKAKSPTATLKKLAHAEKQEKQEEEDTQKKYVISLQKEKEAGAKKVMAAQRQKEKQAEKEQAELTAELNVKTEKKKIEMQKGAHLERQRKKVAVIIRAGKALAIQERKNKNKAYNMEENNAKEKLVKVDVKRVLANRKAKHKKEFADFVEETTERHLKVRKTDKAAANAMKLSKKTQTEQLGQAQEQLKSMRALTHALGLEIEKLKAQADGYQHEINNDAKQGKASPTAETKLSYTMDNVKTEQAREALRRQDIMKKEREILVKMDDLKKLDGEMTKMSVGRRRRQIADKTHVAARNPEKVKMKPIIPKMKSESDAVGGRRRRSKARLMKEYMADIAQSAGTGETLIPGVPGPGADVPAA